MVEIWQKTKKIRGQTLKSPKCLELVDLTWCSIDLESGKCPLADSSLVWLKMSGRVSDFGI